MTHRCVGIQTTITFSGYEVWADQCSEAPEVQSSTGAASPPAAPASEDQAITPTILDTSAGSAEVSAVPEKRSPNNQYRTLSAAPQAVRLGSGIVERAAKIPAHVWYVLAAGCMGFVAVFITLGVRKRMLLVQCRANSAVRPE